MSKVSLRLVVIALMVLVPAGVFAKWLPVHHVESDNLLAVVDGDTGKIHTPDIGFSMVSWQEDTKQAFGHAVAFADGNLYEFRLITVTAANTFDTVDGLWDVYKNGSLACGSCSGSAYGLNGAVGDYYKIVVVGGWQVVPYIIHRFDY